jgi:hypothetical protein
MLKQVILPAATSQTINKGVIEKVRLSLTNDTMNIVMTFLTELTFMVLPPTCPMEVIVLLELYDKLLDDYLRQTEGVKLKLRASEALALKRLLLSQQLTDDTMYLEVQHLINVLDSQLKIR